MEATLAMMEIPIDKQAMEQVFSLFGSDLVRFARSINPIEGEDAAQEAFARLAKRTGRLPVVRNPEAYLVRTVQRLLSRPRQPLVGLEDLADFGVEDLRLDLDLAAAISTLPRRQQACVVLRYGLDMTNERIAEVLGVSTGAVKQHIHRALRSMKKKLEEGAL